MSRLYERAGRVQSEGTPARTGAVTIISAVSPPGGTSPSLSPRPRCGSLVRCGPSTPVCASKAVPAVDWDTSYSLYAEDAAGWFRREGGADWTELRMETIRLLQRDRELREIAGLVGVDALEDGDRLVLEAARIAREFLIGQNAFHPHDAFSSVQKTYHLARLLWTFVHTGTEALRSGVAFDRLDLAAVRVAFGAVKTAPPDELDTCIEDAEERSGIWRRHEDRRPIASRTYTGAASAAGPLLFVESTRRASLGEWVRIEGPDQPERRGQVIDVGGDITVVQVFEDTLGLARPEATITLTGETATTIVGRDLLGRALSGTGEPLDGLPPSIGDASLPLWGAPINPVRREHPSEFIETGVSAIDGMNTLVRGQKLPVFSGPGSRESSSRRTS